MVSQTLKYEAQLFILLLKSQISGTGTPIVQNSGIELHN